MRVLVDTSVWSTVLRKQSNNNFDTIIRNILNVLIDSKSVVLIGAIRQEILSGIKTESLFNNLVIALNKFEDLSTSSEIHIKAAEYFNICRKNGVQGSHIDFLICAISIFYNLPIFTLDKDFQNYQKYIPIKLYKYE